MIVSDRMPTSHDGLAVSYSSIIIIDDLSIFMLNTKLEWTEL